MSRKQPGAAGADELRRLFGISGVMAVISSETELR
jgi:hypothetical protein